MGTRLISFILGIFLAITLITIVIEGVLITRMGTRQHEMEYKIYRLTANQRNIEFFLGETYGKSWIGYRKGMADLMREREEAELRGKK